jgi:hypothetical protein
VATAKTVKAGAAASPRTARANESGMFSFQRIMPANP